MIIAHNMSAINANNKLKRNIDNSSKAIGKLSSGLRISKSADDSAGLAISEKMRSQIRGLEMASRNIQDGISLVQTADGGLGEILDPALQRMRELAIQSANETLTNDDREKLQVEFEQMSKAIDSIANNTEFNGIKLLTTKPLDSNINSVQKQKLKEINWNYVDDGKSFTATSIDYDGNGKYVAVGYGVNNENQIMYSTDATNWTKANSNSYISDVIYSNGVFVATGAYGSHSGADGGLLYSNDGISWNKVVNINPSLDLTCFGTAENAIAFDGNKFTVTGYSSKEGFYKTLTSTNGVDWEVHSNPDKIGCICFDNGKYWGQGYGRVFTSTDGLNWSNETTLGSASYSTNAILHQGDRYFVTGQLNGCVLTSKDGVNWESARLSNDSMKITSIAYDGNQYLAVGNNGVGGKTEIYNSPDGTNWSLQKQLATSGSIGISKVIWDGGRFIASDKDGFSIGIPKYEENKPNEDVSNQIDIVLQVGANSGDTMKLTMCDARTSNIGLSNADVRSSSNAQNAISKIDKAIETISSHRSRIGAYQNSLEHTLSNVQNYNENVTSAESSIRDVDMAKEMMNYTKDNILVQASQAIISQANQRQQEVLKLITI